MTFFYDINKRLAEIDQNKKSIKQLNESSKLNEKMYFDPATGQTTDRTFNTAMQNRQFTADVDRAKSSLYMKPNDSNVYSKERGLGPGMAADRLQQRGVDLPGLVGNRPNPAALDAGLEEDEKLKEMMRLSGLSEDDMEEGNEFSGALDAAREAGEKTFDVDGQTYPVKEGVAEGLEGPAADFFDLIIQNFQKYPNRDELKNVVSKKFKVRHPEVDPEVISTAFAQLYRKLVNPDYSGPDDDVEVGLNYSRDSQRRGEQGVAEGKARKPDFPDIDKDGNTTEPISQAAKDAAKRKIAGKRYGGAAQQDDRDDQEPSRGPGRPEEGGPKHTYDAPFGRVNIPAWKGPRTVHKIGDAEPGQEAPRRGRPKKIGEQQDDMIDIVDRGEYDREGDMAHDQLRTILDAAEELRSILTADENLPEWVQSKITKALDYIDTARDYMKSQKSGETEPVTEKAVSVAQRRAAGIAHAAQKGEIPKEELRGASKEMAKMPKGELKKFAKTEETGLPEKVKETTTSGSVATSDVEAKPKKSKGGVSFGQGIYDSWNRELEVMIAESMDITVTQHTQDDGSIKKTITVNATDEDAEQLAQLLNLAGMDQHDDMHDDHMCPVCHQDPCECAEIVDENSPDWPTSTEYNDDPLQYSGGLNRPKSTGQTTVPVIASQFSRQMSESDQSAVDELDRIRLLLGK